MRPPRTRSGYAAWTVLWLAILGAGCGEPGATPDSLDSNPSPTPNGQLTSDSESRLRAELIQADREFAHSVRSRRLEGWVAAFAEDGMVLPADGPIAVGPEAIRDLFSPLFAEPSFDMSWSPAGSAVARSGDIGYTFGEWETSTGAEVGASRKAEGKYVTVWRKGPDGRWRVLADIGNTQPEASGGD